MKQEQDTTTLDAKKWIVSKIDKLAKEYSTFERKDSKLNMGEGLTIVCALIQAEYENKNLTAEEIADLVLMFNGCHPKKDAIKRYLILEALLASSHVIKVKIVRQSKTRIFEIYRKSSTNFMNEPISNSKDRVGKIEVYGLFENSYFGVPKIVGKIQTGFCRCCRDYEVDKIETQKILDLDSISQLILEKDWPAYRLVVTPK